MGKLMEVTIEDGIGILIMNHLPVNSITNEFAVEMMDTLKDVAKDDRVRVLLIASAIKGIFMAGADIKMLREAVKTGDFSRLHETEVIKPAFNMVQDMPKPTIAVINGHALGGGCEISLACDYRIMARGNRIGLTEVLLGLIPAAGGTQRIVRMVPRPLATRMLLEGVQLDAEEALKVGLVDLVVDGDQLMDEAKKFAKKFAKGPSKTYAALKRCMNEGGDMDMKSGLELERNLFFELVENCEDPKEGLTAFLEKRPAKFTGK
jgi:enoyl-CoA hydratase